MAIKKIIKSDFALALLSALLLIPGWAGLSGITLPVALVPMLVISGRRGGAGRDTWAVLGWCAFAFSFWSIATTWWIWYAAPAGAIVSPVITTVLMGGGFTLYHYVSKRAHKALAYTLLVSVWIAAEYLYTVGEISFPWLTLGNGFANDIKLVQWYDTTGVFGGSLWVLICNILVYEALSLRHKAMAIASVAVIIAPLTISLIKYYAYREPADKVAVTIVQPNIEAWVEKNEMPTMTQVGIMARLMEQEHNKAPARYYITPESAIAETIFETSLRHSPELAYFRELSRSGLDGAQIVLGASTTLTYDPGTQSQSARFSKDYGIWYDHFNSVIAVDSTENLQLRHKSLLVIGAEKTPYYKYLRDAKLFTVDLGGISGHLGSDPHPKVFHSPGGQTYGTAVCYEGIYGGYMGSFARLGAQIIFIISNDGWWRDTRGHKQLFALARLRAVELRRSIARSANTGTSGMITPRGDVVCSLGWDERGALTEEMPLNGKQTFYARYGDYTGRIAAYVFMLSLLYFIAYRVRRKDHIMR